MLPNEDFLTFGTKVVLHSIHFLLGMLVCCSKQPQAHSDNKQV